MGCGGGFRCEKFKSRSCEWGGTRPDRRPQSCGPIAMTAVGLEPTHPKIVELESTALKHSAKLCDEWQVTK